ncbi:MAG TPA: hypothetical protein VMT11_06340 [Myxococcaceae bacterium]|nr:hypothetical protein [Myxococcaceae bacterium]
MERIPLTILLFALVPAAARADQGTEARLRDALRSTTAQLRALEDERAKAKETEAQLRRELETFHGLSVPAPAKSPSVTALSRKLSEQTAANARLKDSLARCEAGIRKPAGAAAAPVEDEERKKLNGEIASLKEKLAAAEAKNLEMYRVGKDLTNWLVEVGVGRERFFGWKSVELENIGQEYEDKLFEQRIKP